MIGTVLRNNRRKNAALHKNMISLTLTRIMYMSENKMVVADALARIDSVLETAPMQVQANALER